MSSDKSPESSSPVSGCGRAWSIVTAQWLARFGLPLVFPDGAMFAVMGGLLGLARADRLVGVLQPRGVVRSHRGRRADVRRDGRDVSVPRRVARHRGDGLHLSDAGRPRHLPRVRDLGGGEPPVVDRHAARDHGRGDRRGVRGVDAWSAPEASRAGSTMTSRGDGRRRLKIACWRLATTRRRRRPSLQRGSVAPAAPVAPAGSAAPAAPVAPAAPAARAAPDAPDAPRRTRERRLRVARFPRPERDGIVRGVHIATDWSASPPKELWRRPIGPGWSSFSVHGDVFYTQEQRGEDEIVAAYRVSTGAPVWKHRDQARFWESNGGPGPRGTPTLAQRPRLFARRHRDSQRRWTRRPAVSIWSRNAGTDSNTKVPDWGFSASPLADRRPGDRRGGGEARRLRSRDRQPALDRS